MNQVIILITLAALISPIQCAIGDLIATYEGHSSGVIDVSVFDGKLYSVGISDNTLRQFRLSDQVCEQVATNVHTAGVNSLYTTQQWIFTASNDNTIKQWLRTNLTFVKSFTGQTTPRRISVSPAGDLLLSCGADGVRLWFTNNASLIRSYAQQGGCFDVSFYNGASQYIAVSILLWLVDVESGIMIRNYTGSGGTAKRLLILNDTFLAMFSGFNGERLQHYNITSGRFFRAVATGNNDVAHRDGKVYVTFSATGVIREYEMSTGNLLFTWQAYQTGIAVNAIVAWDRFLFTSSGSSNIIIQWELAPVPLSQNTGSTSPGSTGVLTLTLPVAGGSGSKTTNINSVLGPNGESSGKNSEQQSSQVTVIIGAVTAGAFLISATVLFVLASRKRKKSKYETKVEGMTTTMTQTDSSFLHGIQTVESTALVTTHELSIPSFLLKEFNKDYVNGNAIAKGGGGTIYTCGALDEEIKARAQGAQLVCKVVSNGGIKRMNERSQLIFYQELSIMWRF